MLKVERLENQIFYNFLAARKQNKLNRRKQSKLNRRKQNKLNRRKQNKLNRRKQNKLNRRAKIGYGYLWLMVMNLSLMIITLFKDCKFNTETLTNGRTIP